MKTFVIAEIGVNHNGKLDLALALVDAVAEAGAHAAKFQTFRADAIAARNTATVTYQKSSGAQDQHEMLKSLELSDEDHRKIAAHCKTRKIEFMSTAFDAESLDLLCDIGIRRIKIPSGEVTNTPYLVDCAGRGLPLILSTGMAELEEVQTAVDVLNGSLGEETGADPFGLPPVTVLHCTSAYPTKAEDVNLRAMTTLARKLAVPVGYSDHTQGIFVPQLAVAMGALIIEKHVTLDRTMVGPDHAASLEPGELKAMIAAIKEVEILLGDGVKAPQAVEMEARALVRRGAKAARDLTAGTVLSRDDVVLLRPATGLSPAEVSAAFGRRLKHPVKAGAPVDVAMLD